MSELSEVQNFVHQISLPQPNSSKGQNGKVLVIGGSRLFHAASFWAASMASKMVDMVHFSSPTMENNDLMRVRVKEKFWEGIVVDWVDVSHYIEEDDSILIGPGMERGEVTRTVVNGLLSRYPTKKWIVDGGALQMVDLTLLTSTTIITPNAKEQLRLSDEVSSGVTILAKGVIDTVRSKDETVKIHGGNAGMTKGGTGDVLAGIVAGFYATTPSFPSAVVASYVNKKASEMAAAKYGTYYSASDLIVEAQVVLGSLITSKR